MIVSVILHPLYREASADGDACLNHKLGIGA